MGTLSRARTLYSGDLPTPVDCDLFIMIGTSLMNGYLASYLTIDSEIKSYYFATGDQTFCQRFGTWAQGFVTPSLNVGQFLYFNNAYNYDASSSRFAPDSVMAKELYYKYGWDRPMFFFHYEQVGASLIAGESTPDWSPSSTVYPLFISNLTYAYNTLVCRGYNPRVSVMWGNGAITSTTVSDYVTAFNTIITGIRTVTNTSARFYIGKQALISHGAASQAYNDGIDLVKASDNLVGSFDYVDFEVSGDDIHPTTMSVFDMGLVFAGYWHEIYYANAYPVLTNVQITGTLQSGQAIGVSYTYTDTDTEDTTIVADTLRLRKETGTRYELYAADDAIGTNRDYMSLSRNKSETYTITGVYIGKYLQALVFPKAQSGSIHGYPVKSAWQGPVIA
jgi:hypothetical protein